MADLSSTTAGQSPQNLVRLAILDFPPGAVISTRSIIHGVRGRDPVCPLTDSQIVDLIVAASTGHTMTIDFDHADQGTPN